MMSLGVAMLAVTRPNLRPDASLQVQQSPAWSTPSMFVQRTWGHSGSDWFANMLAAANVSTYLQFDGLCGNRPDVNSKELETLLSTGCQCIYDRTDETGALNVAMAFNEGDPNRARNNYCTKSCTGLSGACRGVAVVPGNDIWYLGQEKEHIDWLKSYNADVLYVSFVRSNSAKHAVSKLKTGCTFQYLENHPDGKTNVTVGTSFMTIAAPALLRGMRDQSDAQHEQTLNHQAAANASLRTYKVYYEGLEQNPTGGMQALLAAAGMGGAQFPGDMFPAKQTAEDLSNLLVNFDEIDEALKDAPCHHRHLNSASAEVVDACPASELEALLEPKSQWTKQVHHYKYRTMNCANNHDEDCRKAVAKARALGKDPSAVELCSIH
jgi:hypothetical protein